MPLGSMEEIDKVDAERLVRLTHLPILGPAAPLQFLAEASYLIRQGLVGGRARQEPPDPAHEVRSGRRPNQLGLEEKLAELLQ